MSANTFPENLIKSGLLKAALCRGDIAKKVKLSYKKYYWLPRHSKNHNGKRESPTDKQQARESERQSWCDTWYGKQIYAVMDP